jgi:pimeloyl-ACP methyl ester carboxylesterase
MSESTMEIVSANGVDLEVVVRGSGEPVVFIQTALVADEFIPVATQPALRDSYQLILYHRRGYAGSAAVDAGPGSIARDADDCRALLAALGIPRAHIVGLSYSGAVALQLAVDAPQRVHSLSLLEPPPIATSSADLFVQATAPAVLAYHAGDPARGADILMTLVAGRDWRSNLNRAVPGAAEQIEKDAVTFFQCDWPAVLAWQFGADDAGRITQPVLHIGGSDSGPLFAAVRELIRSWLPQTEHIILTGADHAMAITHPADVAVTIVDFLQRHPIPAAP